MDFLAEQLPNLQNFGIYFGTTLVFIFLFQKIYDLVTPYDEWALIKSNNSAAAIGFIGSILGFTLALASASAHSVSLTDFAVWGTVALIAQVIGFFFVRLLMPKIVTRIENGEVAAGITLGGISLVIGIANASCMFS